MIVTEKRVMLLLILITAAFVCTSCTVKKISEVDAQKENGAYSTWTKSGSEFKPVEYVNENWDSRFVPAFRDKCVDIHTVISALESDRAKASEEFGLTKTQAATSFTFKVKGEAVVLAYDNSSLNGFISIDLLPDPDGTADAKIQTGPVIKKTALRDSVEFIKFTDIGNQLQFASLADELNNKMKKVVIEPLDLENITGKTISFYGAFKLEQSDSVKDIVIAAVILDVKE